MVYNYKDVFYDGVVSMCVCVCEGGDKWSRTFTGSTLLEASEQYRTNLYLDIKQSQTSRRTTHEVYFNEAKMITITRIQY